jgi:hypothetical protein
LQAGGIRILFAALLGVAVLAGGAGAAPTAPSPDPAKMVLATTDFSASTVDAQSYGRPNRDLESSYERDFTDVLYRGREILFLASGADVGTTAAVVKAQLTAVTKLLSTKKGRQAFAGIVKESLPAGAKVTVGKPRSLGIGDGSLEFTVTAVIKKQAIYFGIAYIRVDRVLDTLGAGTIVKPATPATIKSLGSIVVKRTKGALLPANSVLPTITGTPLVGQPLTATTGRWTGTPTFTYQWLHCDASGAACTPIPGATAASYTPTTADVGGTLRVAVTAHAPGGAVTVQSLQTAPVTQPGPPVNTALPAITGTAQQGQTLTASTGTWTGAPTAFAYQWQHCDAAGANCTAVAGATAATYVVSSADVGFTLSVTVTATNASGSAPATSAPTTVVS